MQAQGLLQLANRGGFGDGERQTDQSLNNFGLLPVARPLQPASCGFFLVPTYKRKKNVKTLTIALAYLVMGTAAFALMWTDKRSAREGDRRISEFSLVLMSFFCGWPGVFSGMKVFHHKTRKTSFKFAVKLSAIFNIMALWILFNLL